MNRGRILGALLVLTSVSLGCGGGSDVDLRAVSGTVTWDGGDPVADADITFMPESGGTSSTARTDSSGNFTMRTGTGATGALVAKHKVIISRRKDDTQVNFGDPASLEQMAANRGGGDKKTRGGSAGPEVSAGDASIPAKYGKTAETPLSYDVTADGSHGSVSFVLQKS